MLSALVPYFLSPSQLLLPTKTKLNCQTHGEPAPHGELKHPQEMLLEPRVICGAGSLQVDPGRSRCGSSRGCQGLGKVLSEGPG